MNSSKLIVRGTALALLLAAVAACGDDGGDDDPAIPAGDSAVGDGGRAEAGAGDGGNDGGSPDGGNIDGGGGNVDGGDARAPMDARIFEASIGDASSEELQAALNRDGVRVDARRAELVLPAFCRKGAQCGFGAGITEASCLSTVQSDWSDSVNGGDSAACLDAQLDWWSCITVIECRAAGCDAVEESINTLCAAAGDGGA